MIGLLARAVRLAAHGGPDAERDHNCDRRERAEHQVERIEGDSGRSLGGTRLAQRSDRGEQGGNGHGAHCTREPHRQTARVAQHDQLSALQAECDQRRIFLALGGALTP